MRRFALAITVMALPSVARAQDAADARGVATAGASVTSADGTTALALNPAGIGRRPTLRVQLGVGVLRESATLSPAPDAPAATNRAGVSVLPHGALQFGLGDRLVVSAGWINLVSRSGALAEPAVYERPLAEDETLYPGQHGATRFALREDAAVIAAAVLPVPWFSLGLSTGVRRIQWEHATHIWGGGPEDERFAPDHDVRVASGGTSSGFVAIVGVVAAPPAFPVELAASVTWSPAAEASGTTSPRQSRGRLTGAGRALVEASPGSVPSALHIPGAWTVRGGARGTVGRVGLEFAGAYTHSSSSPGIDLEAPLGLHRPGDDRQTEVTSIPVGPALSPHLAASASADLDVVRDFLVVHTAYRFTSASAERGTSTLAWPGLVTHTVAAGAEARVWNHAVAVGISHTFALSSDDAAVSLPVLAPFVSTSSPAHPGRLDASRLRVAVTLEKEW